MTLVDVLDTFVVMGDIQGFDTAVKNVIKAVSFNVNTRPQVFEATIRVLGGLLSAHIFASRPNQPFYLPWYKDELLHMAHDLGNRLLPAFSTPTGIPYARVRTFGSCPYLYLSSVRSTSNLAYSKGKATKLVRHRSIDWIFHTDVQPRHRWSW